MTRSLPGMLPVLPFAFLLCSLLCGCGSRSNTSQKASLSTGAAWISDTSLAGQLGPEEQIGGYGLRPPGGYSEQQIQVNANDGGGVRYIWTGPKAADGTAPFLQLDVGADNGAASSGITSDIDVQIGFQVAAQNHTGIIYSPIEQGVVNGLAFSRGYWTGYGQKTGKPFHGLVYGRIASPSVLTIQGRDAAPQDRQSLPLLEASALTLHKL